jgi:maleylacetate reductase
MDEFRYSSYAQEIIFGSGSIERLGEVIQGYGCRRLLLVTTGSMRRGGQIDALKRTLGERFAAIYEGAQPHVPDFQVAEALDLARSHAVDAIIGLGGGSYIGMAKAVSFALEEGGNSQDGAPARVPVIAIPTTYAGSEMTPVYGITRHDRHPPRKVTVSDPRITPRLAVYDPLLTLDLPPEMTASTGINALAHCMEALYSIARNPISTAIALGGVRSIYTALPKCYADGGDVEARTEMLAGSMLAGMALAHVAMGLHHGLCHVLGGTAGVPHGIANAIVLPHALRFNLDATAPQLSRAAEAMGVPVEGRRTKDGGAEAAGEEVIDRIHSLIGGMNLPQRLRDVGVQKTDLPHLAELALESKAVRQNPKHADVAQVGELLLAAW